MNMNNTNEIPIFFGIDDAYAPYIAVALNSAVKNSSKSRRYRAIVLYNELSRENQQRLAALSAEHFSIEFVNMESRLDFITDRRSNRLRFDCFTLSIYFRLFIPTMFPQYAKGIYIDSDVVLVGDIAELYDTDIGENYIGACTDYSIFGSAPLVKYVENVVGVPMKEYINSGVLLMNMEKLRRIGFAEHFSKLLVKYHFDTVAPDQDYINAICNGNIHYLSPVWDAMPCGEDMSGAKLIHYNLYSKPWLADGVQCGEYFWQYAADCGYYREIMESRERARPVSNEESLKILVEHSQKILNDDPVTMKKVGESGVRIKL
jgi:lipopolysaccharide biosynthesis glycosyltransferase